MFPIAPCGCRVQLPGREPSRFPRFPFLVPTQKRETDRETPETGRKRRKPPGFPFPDFTGKLLPDGKLNPARRTRTKKLSAAAVAKDSSFSLFRPSPPHRRRHGKEQWRRRWRQRPAFAVPHGGFPAGGEEARQEPFRPHRYVRRTRASLSLMHAAPFGAGERGGVGSVAVPRMAGSKVVGSLFFGDFRLGVGSAGDLALLLSRTVVLFC